MEGTPIPEERVNAALLALAAINPPFDSLLWEYQEARTMVLFSAKIGHMSEDDALAIYDAAIRMAIRNAIPETGALMTWLVVLSDLSGRFVTSIGSA